MSPGAPFAPRATIAFLAAMHALLFAAFLSTLATLSAQAAPACGGRDLVAEMRLSEPARLAAIEAQAAAIPNGEAAFWKIERPGSPPSYLLGTMHSPDPRIAKIGGGVEAALAAARTVLVENVESLDPQKMLAVMASLRDVAFLPAGTDLATLLGEADAALARRAAAARNLPWELAGRMQPWMFAAAVATPLCDSLAKREGSPVLDAAIAARAAADGKELIGLETVAEQFAAISALPREFHLRALAESLKQGDLSDAVMATTKELYLQGRIAMILPLMRAVAPAAWGEGDAERFQELLIVRRNAVMAERASPQLQRGGAFLAVGAMHLPGEKGLVALLRVRGFAVTPADR